MMRDYEYLQQRAFLRVELLERRVVGVAEVVLAPKASMLKIVRLHARQLRVRRVQVDGVDATFEQLDFLGEIVDEAYRDLATFDLFYRGAIVASIEGELIIQLPREVQIVEVNEEEDDDDDDDGREGGKRKKKRGAKSKRKRSLSADGKGKHGADGKAKKKRKRKDGEEAEEGEEDAGDEEGDVETEEDGDEDGRRGQRVGRRRGGRRRRRRWHATRAGQVGSREAPEELHGVPSDCRPGRIRTRGPEGRVTVSAARRGPADAVAAHVHVLRSVWRTLRRRADVDAVSRHDPRHVSVSARDHGAALVRRGLQWPNGPAGRRRRRAVPFVSVRRQH
ncbi:hypothetical protein PINS_up012422 [Pythium insidiosum]|nr:hypothetical protein PINS_up012422 [Pythium insidiosum]